MPALRMAPLPPQVHLVELQSNAADGFNVTTDTDDGCHPNGVGEAKMAALFADSIEQHCDATRVAPVVDPDCAAATAAADTWSSGIADTSRRRDWSV